VIGVPVLGKTQLQCCIQSVNGSPVVNLSEIHSYTEEVLDNFLGSLSDDSAAGYHEFLSTTVPSTTPI